MTPGRAGRGVILWNCKLEIIQKSDHSRQIERPYVYSLASSLRDLARRSHVTQSRAFSNCETQTTFHLLLLSQHKLVVISPQDAWLEAQRPTRNLSLNQTDVHVVKKKHFFYWDVALNDMNSKLEACLVLFKNEKYNPKVKKPKTIVEDLRES